MIQRLRFPITVALLTAAVGVAWPTLLSGQNSRPKPPGPACQPIANAASQTIAKDACIQAHVYDVVELSDGTRFLDVCPPEIPDEGCHFLLVSERADREDVGDLRRYRGQDITVRGALQPMHGRMGMTISHVRQFSGGPPKFKPNPRLLHGFNAESGRMPVRDPNLRSSGHVRSFMDTRDKEAAKH